MSRMVDKTTLIQKKKVIFLHIPKAGGSTLIDILRTVYTEEKVVHIWPNGKVKEIEQLRRLKAYKFDLVVGHFNFGVHRFIMSPIQYITVVRDPIERLISHYNYVKRYESHYLHREVIDNKITLADYLTKPRSAELDNGQIRMLINSKKPIGKIDKSDLEEAKQNLINFFIFGTLENWELTLKKFAANLGWGKIPEYKIKNSTKSKNREISDIEFKKVQDLNKWDLALYNFVKAKM